MERQTELRERMHALGFDQVRFARLGEAPGQMERRLSEWLAAGYQADMGWMERTADKRTDPSLVQEGAKSLIMLGVNYWPGPMESGQATWARYALYQDYHDTIKAALIAAGRLLEELYGVGTHDYRYYVDTGPILERGWAERSGLGFIGKNAMLISPDFGNWLFLSELITRLDFAPDPPLAPARNSVAAPTAERVGLYCGKCTRCMDACPTAAIRSPGVVDARRCISYQTIENRGIIPRELRAGIGARIYGCDVCLEVCPWNRFAQKSRLVLLQSRYDLAKLTLVEILQLTPERFAEIFRKTPIKRTKLSGLLRNACIVAANTEASECVNMLISLALEGAPVVRAHAVWAVYRLMGPAAAHAALSDHRALETDTAVLAEYASEDREQDGG